MYVWSHMFLLLHPKGFGDIPSKADVKHTFIFMKSDRKINDNINKKTTREVVAF